MTSWFRSWHGAPTDAKWLAIARRANVQPGIVSAVAWALLDYASQQPERGSVDGFDTETYAAFSGFDEAQIAAVIDAMTDKGMIDDDTRWASWDKRQPEREDNSSERVRRYRETHRNGTGVTVAQDEAVTQCNAVTRNVTHSNAPDTDTDTDNKESVAYSVEVIAPQAARPAKTSNKKGRAPKAPPPAEIALVRSVTNRYPDKALWESIVSAVSGKTETDIRAAYTTWVARGFNPTNYAWLLEWVPNGIPPAPGRNGRSLPAIPAGLPTPEMVWGTVQAEIDRVHYFGTPNLPQPIMSAVEAVGGWYAVCKCDPGGSIPARLRDAYRSAIGAG